MNHPVPNHVGMGLWGYPESTEGVGVRGILRGRKGAPLNLG